MRLPYRLTRAHSLAGRAPEPLGSPQQPTAAAHCFWPQQPSHHGRAGSSQVADHRSNYTLPKLCKQRCRLSGGPCTLVLAAQQLTRQEVSLGRGAANQLCPCRLGNGPNTAHRRQVYFKPRKRRADGLNVTVHKCLRFVHRRPNTGLENRGLCTPEWCPEVEGETTSVVAHRALMAWRSVHLQACVRRGSRACGFRSFPRHRLDTWEAAERMHTSTYFHCPVEVFIQLVHAWKNLACLEGKCSNLLLTGYYPAISGTKSCHSSAARLLAFGLHHIRQSQRHSQQERHVMGDDAALVPVAYVNGKRHVLPPGRAEVTLLTYLRGR